MSTFPVPREQEVRELINDLKRRVATLENQTVQAAIAGAPPTGPAGGDLAGTYPNPSVARPPFDQAPFTYAGPLALYVGASRLYNDSGRTLTFGTIRASVGTAPTGASVIVDVLKNGSTIFTTTGHRPTIAAGTNTATNSGAPDVATIANGEYLTVSIVQVGSTVAGADLTVSVVMT